MFQRFAKNQPLKGRRELSGETSSLTILPAGRASLNPDGVVFLNVASGVVFKSNRVGSRIWEGVQKQQNPAAIAAQISREYCIPNEQASEDTATFLAQLEAEGFLARKVSGSQS